MKKLVSILLLSSVFCMHAMKEGSNSDDILWTIRESVDTEENIDLEQREKDVPEINAAVYELQPSMPSKTKKSKRGALQQHLQGSVDALQKEKSNPSDGPALIIDLFNIDADYFKQETNMSVAQFVAGLSEKQVAGYYADYKQKSCKPVVRDNSSKTNEMSGWAKQTAQEALALLNAGIGFDSKD